MGWATEYIERLKKGEAVEMRPQDRSMEPRVRSGQRCVVEPVDCSTIKVGDVVLCRIASTGRFLGRRALKREYLHLVSKVVEKQGYAKQFQISNNHGYVNGLIYAIAIFGRLKE